MDLNTYLKKHEPAILFAARLKIAPALISQWRNGVRPIPAERCPAIERATAGAVTCEDLRPDVDWAVLRGSARSEHSPASSEQIEAT